MSFLIDVNPLKELQCKIKSHIPSQEFMNELDKNPDYSIECICERCGVSIKIEIDQEDDEYIIVTEL